MLPNLTMVIVYIEVGRHNVPLVPLDNPVYDHGGTPFEAGWQEGLKGWGCGLCCWGF